MIIVSAIGLGFSLNASAEEGLIPSWIKNTVSFWVEDEVSDTEFVNAMQFLIKEEIIEVPSEEDLELSELKAENERLERVVDNLDTKLKERTGDYLGSNDEIEVCQQNYDEMSDYANNLYAKYGVLYEQCIGVANKIANEEEYRANSTPVNQKISQGDWEVIVDRVGFYKGYFRVDMVITNISDESQFLTFWEQAIIDNRNYQYENHFDKTIDTFEKMYPDVIQKGYITFEKIPEDTESIRLLFELSSELYEFKISLDN